MLAAAGGRAPAPHDLHVTLCFLGAVGEAQLAMLCERAAKIEAVAFELAFDGLALWRTARMVVASAARVPTAGAALSAALVSAAREAGLAPDDWTFAFQSQGMSDGAWLGPRVEDTILELKEKGHRGIFVQPIGFLCDHVEVLYDIDIGFKEFAANEDMRLWRAESLNDSGLLTGALADLVRSRIEE